MSRNLGGRLQASLLIDLCIGLSSVLAGWRGVRPDAEIARLGARLLARGGARSIPRVLRPARAAQKGIRRLLAEQVRRRGQGEPPLNRKCARVNNVLAEGRFQ